MTFFENLLVLLLIAVILLQVARRLSLPYPALLAGAGVLVGMIPGTRAIPIEPETYLALFIAPVLVDAAYDFPLGATRRYLAPLIAFAVFAVILSSVIVACIAHVSIGLPLAAGLVLGAIVAPPDAAAATAVLRGISIPRDTSALLQGESLFNDSTALLLFSIGLEILYSHGLRTSVAVRFGLAAPGGILLGIACGYGALYVNRLVKGTLGGNLLQFVLAYSIWILAMHLKLSAVLCTIAFAMTLARRSDSADFNARMRVQSYAVWSAVVFTLNVFAFMLMGMQARLIVGRMAPERLHRSLIFASMIVVALIVVRIVVVLAFNRLDRLWERAHGRAEPASWRHALFVGWCGMRGFVTMATALALPESFPERDTVVLTAFCVVLATLVVQGVTLSPLIRLLGLDGGNEAQYEYTVARAEIVRAALISIDEEPGAQAQSLRTQLQFAQRACAENSDKGGLDQLRMLGLRAVQAERDALEEIRSRNDVSIETYLKLQEQMDWKELTFVEDEFRKIEEI
jgi:monovalent cation/hydrogen antiporter